MRVLVGLLLGAGCAPMRYDQIDSPPSPPPLMQACSGGERVMPRFAWPREFEAEAHGRELTWRIHTRVRGRDAPHDPLPPRCTDCRTSVRRTRYRGRRDTTTRILHFQVHPEGERWSAGFTALSPASNATRRYGFAPSIGELRPTLLFDARGGLVEVRGSDAMREAAERASLGGAYGEFVPQRGGPDDGRYRWEARDGQREVAESTWGLMLGALHGQALVCGQPLRSGGRLPGLAAHSAPMQGEQRIDLLGRMRCGPDEALRECIVVRVGQQVDAEHLLRALQPERPADGAPWMTSGRLYRWMVLVTEAETLVPHDVEFYEAYRIRWQRELPTPAEWNFERMSWQEYDFRYGSAMGRLRRRRGAEARRRAREAEGEPAGVTGAGALSL